MKMPAKHQCLLVDLQLLAQEVRLAWIRDRLNDIWFSGKGPAGGEILDKYKEEFEALLQEELNLQSEYQRGSWRIGRNENARQAPLLSGPVECEPDSKVALPEEGCKMRRWRYRAWRLPNGSKVVCVLDREFPPSPDYDIQWEHQTSNGRFGVDVISREQAKILLRGPRTPCEWDVDTLKGE